MSTTASPSSDTSWPTAPPGAPGLKIGFPGAHEVATPSRHIGLRAIIVLLSAAVVALMLVVAALLATPGPAPYCHPLSCQGPPVGNPVVKGATQGAAGSPEETGLLFRGSNGFTLRYLPTPNVTSYGNGLNLTYVFNNASLGTGYLDVLGKPAGNSTDQSLVEGAAATLWGSNAQRVYYMPDPLIGYHPAWGEAYNVTPASSDGSTRTIRALVAAATYNGYSILVITDSPLLPTVTLNSPYSNGHASPAGLIMAYFPGTDVLLKSVVFP